jgi:hypothetical protein
MKEEIRSGQEHKEQMIRTNQEQMMADRKAN